MIPRWHIILGFLFTLLIWIVAPEISIIYLALIFLASFLIDFDHYVASLIKTRKPRLNDSLEYHRKAMKKEKKEIARGIRNKSDFHLFHTVEFLILIGLLGIVWNTFFYIFIGMIFHSFLDVIYALYHGAFHRREYFFFNWARKKVKRN